MIVSNYPATPAGSRALGHTVGLIGTSKQYFDHVLLQRLGALVLMRQELILSHTKL